MRSIVLIIVFCFVALFGWVSWRTIDFLFIPPSSDNTQVNFDIEPGTAFNNIAEKLYEQNFIKDKLLFKVLAKVMSATGTMRVGEYALNKNMTPLKILEVLSSGKSIQYSLTFQEGINMYEIALLIEQKNLGQRDDFLSLCKDKALIKELLNQDIESLEGYLFPETYLVTKFTGAKKLIQLMVGNFKKAYDSVSQSAKVEMPLHKLVTLASIIEKETGAPNERPMISSVFHNRLKKGMRLQSDPTIIYGIMDLNGGKEVNNIRKVDILTKTRYNTYKINGLPYGPIANPGIEALRAALNPADSDYLYFVSRNNGTHVFSKTYQEHNSAVKKFQLDKKMREGRSWRDLNK